MASLGLQIKPFPLVFLVFMSSDSASFVFRLAALQLAVCFLLLVVRMQMSGGDNVQS